MADPLDLYEAAPTNSGPLAPYRAPDPLGPSSGTVLARRGAFSIVPAGGGFAGFSAGATVGGVAGAPLDPFTFGGASVVLGLGGGLYGAYKGGQLADEAQTAIADYASGGSYSAQRRADEAAHPLAAFIGENAAQLAFMRPSRGLNLLPRAFGAAFGGGVEAGREAVSGEPLDPARIGVATAFGAAMDHETALGSGIAGTIRRGAGRTQAAIGANLAIAQGLGEVPGVDVTAARDAFDPNISADTRASMASSLALQRVIGDRRTPAEIAAGHVVDGDAHTEATNPLGGDGGVTPAGAEAHGAALATALDQLDTGQPVDVALPRPVYSGDQAVADKIIGVEAGWKANAKNPDSTAAGLGQFTDQTWLAMLKKHGREMGQDYAAENIHYDMHTGKYSVADPTLRHAILGLKNDASVARPMTRQLTSDNRFMLMRENVPVTDGTLYLAHFLGPRATRLLRADPSTPVSELLPDEFITSNRKVLAGKTAGEVIAWADKKMGGAGVLPDGTPPSLLPDRTQAIVDDAPPALPQEADASAPAPSIADEVPGFTTAKGSTYDLDEAGRTTRNKAFRPEHGEAEQGPQPTSDKTFYVDPEQVEPLGLIQAEGGVGRMRVVLNEAGTHAGLQYVDGPQAGKMIAGTIVPAESAPRVGAIPVELWNDGSRVHFGNEITEVRAAKRAQRRVAPASPRLPSRSGPVDALTFLADHGGLRDDEGHDLRGRGKLISGAISGQRRRGGSAGIGLPQFAPGGGHLFRKAGMSIDDAGELLHEAGYFTGDRPTTSAVIDMLADSNRRPVYRPEDMAEAHRAEMEARFGSQPLEHFSEPDGIGADWQADSIEHDLRMSLADDPGLGVVLDENGDVVNVADLLDGFAEEEHGVQALRGCAAPGGEA